MTRIIVVEDDLDQQEEILSFLTHAGHDVRGASSGLQLADCLHDFVPQVVLLDYNLAGADESGAQLVRDLRTRFGTSVGLVMVTARGAAVDRVECRRAGADDYLVKPIDFAELLAVVDNLRVRLDPSPVQLAWRLLMAHSALAIPECPTVSLTGWELAVLDVMARSENQQVSRKVLIEALGKKPWAYDERALEAGISRLRRKFPPLEDGRMALQAVRGVGYKFTHPLVIVN